MIDQVEPTKRLPVRRNNELFRGRRISLTDLGEQVRIEAQVNGFSLSGNVKDVSSYGLSFETDAVINFTNKIERESLLSNFIVRFQEKDLAFGSGVIKHIKYSKDRNLIGLMIKDSALDLESVHKMIRSIKFQKRWNEKAKEASLDWKMNDFSDWVQQVAYSLNKLRIFLQNEEARLASEDRIVQQSELSNIFEHVKSQVSGAVHLFRQQLNQWVEGIDAKTHQKYQKIVRQYLQSLFCADPFTQRTLQKPLGYAGDYEMMDMLYRVEPEGLDLFGRILNCHSKEEPAGQATINRIKYVGELIFNTVQSFNNVERVEIASIGCGAAREISTLIINKPELGRRISFTLFDQDIHAIENCERVLSPIARDTNLQVKFVCDPIQRLMTATPLLNCFGHKHLIYSVGLFDYLDDSIFLDLTRVLYAILHEGGRLVVGNMANHNPTQYWMEYVMDWYLIYRSKDELRSLGQSIVKDETRLKIDCEPQGINLFMHLLQ